MVPRILRWVLDISLILSCLILASLKTRHGRNIISFYFFLFITGHEETAGEICHQYSSVVTAVFPYSRTIKLQYTLLEDYWECVRQPARLPVLTWVLSSVPPGNNVPHRVRNGYNNIPCHSCVCGFCVIGLIQGLLQEAVCHWHTRHGAASASEPSEDQDSWEGCTYESDTCFVPNGTVGWGTALQARRSRIQFPMVSVIFHWHNTSCHSLVLGLTQPQTEISTRNFSLGVMAVDV